MCQPTGCTLDRMSHFLGICSNILGWNRVDCVSWFWFCAFLLLFNFALIDWIRIPFIRRDWLFQYYILILMKRQTVRMSMHADFALRLVRINERVCTSWTKRCTNMLTSIGRRWFVRINIFLFFCYRLRLSLRLFLLGQSYFAIHKMSCQLWLHIPDFNSMLIHVFYKFWLEILQLLMFVS